MSEEIKAPTIAELEADLVKFKAEQELESKDATIARMLAEKEKMIADREQEKAEAAQRFADASLRIAKAEAQRKSEGATRAQGEIIRTKAIEHVGGLAKWNQLDPATRAAALGISADVASVSDKELRLYFGKTSSSIEASRLIKNNRARYDALRQLARDRNIY